LEKIVLKNNEAIIHASNVAKNIFPILKHLVNGGCTAVDVEICLTSEM
jgi:hypothetical protein